MAGGGEYPYEAEKVWIKALEERSLVGNRCYEHFRGRKYKVLFFGKDSETSEEVVIYQALYGSGQIWVRPYKIFFSKVTDENGNEVDRFRPIQD